MSESFEPKTDWGHRLVVAALTTMVTLIVLAALYNMIWGEDPDQTITPGQLREVVNEYREKRRQRMIEEIAEMRKDLAEVRAIRDRNQAQAGLAGDAASALTDFERDKRQMADQPVDDLPFEDVYDVARAVEQDMITLYREFLAAKMAAVRPDMDYITLYEHADTPRPTRPDLDVKALHREITTTEEGGGLEPFKDQIKQSTVECREMMENCERLLAFTKKADKNRDIGISVDLDADDLAMLGYHGLELLPDEIDFTYTPDLGYFNAIPGRRITSDGDVQEWMYVDTWYVIGPFPGDRRRENLDTRFGPEANVNLDDVFTGMDDRKIRWEYKKVGWVQDNGQKNAFWKIEPKIVEGYAIYYAFTEIYSETDRDVWIATATDDYGKLWINDELTWTSPKERKPYNATENIQKISLKQGFNKVLYRVENAGGTMGFSLIMRLNNPQEEG